MSPHFISIKSDALWSLNLFNLAVLLLLSPYIVSFIIIFINFLNLHHNPFLHNQSLVPSPFYYFISAVPIVKAEVSLPWDKLFSSFKVLFKVVSSQSISEVYISTNLHIFLLASNKNNSCHSTISYVFLSFGEFLKENAMGEITASTSKTFWLVWVLIFNSFFNLLLFPFEFLPLQELSLRLVSKRDQLSGQLSVFEIEQISVGDVVVKVRIVVSEAVETCVNIVPLEVVVIHFIINFK